MKDRISHLMSLEQLNPTQFAAKLGVQRSGISHFLSGRNKPSFDFIEKVLQIFPTLNPRWFILGEGKPYLRDEKPPKPGLPEGLFLTKNEPLNAQPVPDNSPAPPQLQTQSDRKIEQIVVFYSDKTFKLYSE